MANPIQIVLGPENFKITRESVGGGSSKDFFAGRDYEFCRHRQRLLEQMKAVSAQLEAQTETDIGYVKVTMRRSAWAKSHRPIKSLFMHKLTPVVGGMDIGVMVVEANPRTVNTVSKKMAKAEDQTNRRFNEKKGREEPRPTRIRSEVGAISKVEIFQKEDKRNFSLDEAIEWLSRSDTGGAYEIELFTSIPHRSAMDALDKDHQGLYSSFRKGLSQFGNGLVVRTLAIRRREQPRLTVRLGRSDERAALHMDSSSVGGEPRQSVAPFDSSRDRHWKLLNFLDNHPLVRRISLPGVIAASAINHSADVSKQIAMPIRKENQSYARLAVIDGGIGEALDGWIIDRWDILADEDMDQSHGSFIGGLVVAGRTLNGEQICPEPNGTELMDIAILPDTSKADTFNSYYPEGIFQFFDELEAAVIDAKKRHGIRIFNMSINVRQPAKPENYSPYAALLDRISDDNDVLFFISAGNTDPQNIRPEWSDDETQALAGVAAARNDGILMPAESVRNSSVAALNPPAHPGSVPYAPARYSCRGPGLRAGVKPDFAHVGGSGSPKMPQGHGLFSVFPDGTVFSDCGTSYATPLVAKTVAELDKAIEGHVSRETLLGLLVHGAQLPESLSGKALKPIARHMAGFGLPANSEQILESDDHQITLVFATRIKKCEQLSFRFPWPQPLVGQSGKCRGAARLTLVASPPIDTSYGAEFVRINVEAALQQESRSGKWEGRLESPYLKEQKDVHAIEAERIEHGLKWSVVKLYERKMPKGVGYSSNWRLSVNYLTRTGEHIPDSGVFFTAILTISDIDGREPVFNDMKQTLNNIGIQTADIRTAARIIPRV